MIGVRRCPSPVILGKLKKTNGKDGVRWGKVEDQWRNLSGYCDVEKERRDSVGIN